MAYIANSNRFYNTRIQGPFVDLTSNEFMSLGLQSFSCEEIAIAIFKNEILTSTSINALSSLIR